MRTAVSRVDELPAVLVTDDAIRAVVAFELAYRELSPGQRRLLRYLGLHPGPDFDVYAAAVLSNLTVVHARQGLGKLCERRLVVQDGIRYRLPEQVAEHARRLVARDPAASREVALGRLRDHLWPPGERGRRGTGRGRGPGPADRTRRG
ncbi:hypothetical protein [Plantactinospora sp. B24E8]|uniref:hypothetical protein n=1 Tax=Plantactinospora sp. B24E8 TaxID=3153567 RepID=UPI00325C6352